jgi:heat-inducible transcriptional repressor
VSLSSTAATVVVVFGNGSVENVTIELAEADDDEALGGGTAHLSSARRVHPGVRRSRSDRHGAIRRSTALSRALGVRRIRESPTHVYVGGAAAVAKAFDAVEVVRQVLHTLEQQFVVVSLVRDIVDRGMSVAIGVEHGVEPLSACSVVVAPVVVDGEHLGSVGVLGPTRMNYPQALATVEVVSEQLGHRIEEG